MGKDEGKERLTVKLTEENKPLVSRFIRDYQRIKSSGLINLALEYYILDIERFGMNEFTQLPKVPHLENAKEKESLPKKTKLK